MIMGPYLRELCDSHVELRDLFPGQEISALVQRLVAAADRAERVACIESFLLDRIRFELPQQAVYQAALQLQSDCSLAVRDLAAHVGICERQLSRTFRAVYGVGPKRFARLVRMTRALELRQRGFGWLDAVNHCGYSDQAHLINDFNALVSHPPEIFFRMISARPVREINASLSQSVISNTFVV